MQQSYFTVLGLPERFAVDPAALERAFHAMSRSCHPDRFAEAPPAERRLAVQRTTLLNDAYRALKDPMGRAEYLLAREGKKRGEEQGTRDADLLAEVMEGRETVAELKERLAAGDGAAREDLARLRSYYEGKVRALLETLEGLFARYDTGERGEVVAEVASRVERNRYYLGIKAELDELALREP
jgi:molecular chaperone HscB